MNKRIKKKKASQKLEKDLKQVFNKWIDDIVYNESYKAFMIISSKMKLL